MKRKILLGFLVIAGAIVAVSLNSTKNQEPTQEKVTNTTPEMADQQSEEFKEETSVSLTKKGFSPDKVILKKGSLLRIHNYSGKEVKLKKKDGDISESMTIPNGSQKEISIIEPGDYVFMEEEGGSELSVTIL